MVQGNTHLIPFIDEYKYNGFLLRLKKFLDVVGNKTFSPYGAVYFGNLNRDVYYEGYVDRTGFFSVAGKNFKDSSLRGGVSAGLCYLTKSQIIFDAQTSLGYGKYLNRGSINHNKSNGYLDLQFWLSIGYAF